MGSEWSENTFQELLDDGVLEIGDGYRAKNAELDGEGPIFLRAGHVTDTHIDFCGTERFRAELEEKVASKMSAAGDTVITTKGNSTGRTAFVTDDMPPFVYSPHLSYWRSLDEKSIVPGFLRYWSQGAEFVGQLHGMSKSTDMAPYLSLRDQKRLRVTLPPLPEQRAIAGVLGSLDDKIELNRRMNRTLESMARALFRHRFLDHPDPAWEDGKLGDILASQRRSVDAESLAEATPYFGLEHVPRRSIALDAWGTSEALKSQKSAFREGEILFGKLRPYFHKVGIAPLDGVCSTDILVLAAKKPAYRAFARCHCFSDELIAHCTALSTGTKMPRAKLKDLTDYPITLPPESVASAFDEQMEPLFRRVITNIHESRTLSALRDTLLPRLLSGQIKPSISDGTF